MIPEFLAIAHLYAMDDRTLDRLVGDFSASDWKARDAAGHTPRWITGHLAAARLRLVGMMGLPPMAEDWMAAFGRGTSDADVPVDLDLRQVVQAFHAAHERMASGWERLTAEELAKPLGRTLPDGSDTIGGAIRFLAWHEAYHLGQLGLLRRLMGKPGLAWHLTGSAARLSAARSTRLHPPGPRPPGPQVARTGHPPIPAAPGRH